MVTVRSSGQTATPSSTPNAAFLSLFQGLVGGFSQRENAKSQRDLARFNERAEELRAEDARRRGVELAALSRGKTKKVRGSQRATLAASGVDVSTGSAADVQAETEDIGETEAITIKNNAMREAFGFETKGAATRLKGELAFRAGTSRATETFLTGGVRTAKFLGDFKRNRR